MKRYIVLFLVAFLFFSNIGNVVFAKDAPPSVSADSAVLIDATTGTILYSKNMDAAYPPASTTKVMTALLTIENSNLDDVVTIGKNPPYIDGSKIGIFEGEQIKVKDLLYGLLLLSGNDCAVALAEHVAGSVDNFAKLMNEKAKELGCEDTNFVNSCGLYDPNHKTSAKDLALIMREAMKHPEFKEIASTFAYKIPPTNKHPEGINLASENKLINKGSVYYYENAEAGKTGYTIQSAHSYVASASKDGHRLIVALVHDQNKTFFPDAKNLFNYGFNNFELDSLYKKGDVVSTISDGKTDIPLLASDDYYYVKEKGSSEVPKTSVSALDLKDKDFKKGDNVAEASVSFNNKPLDNLKLVSGIDHGTKSVFNSNLANKKSSKKIGSYFIIPASVLLILALSVLILRAKRKRRRRSYSKWKYKK